MKKGKRRVDPNPDNNREGIRFLREAAQENHDPEHEVDQVDTPAAATERLASREYDLVVTRWGHEPGDAPSRGIQLLDHLKTLPDRPPVVVFSVADETGLRRRQALRRVAIDYCHRWEDLFRLVAQVLEGLPH